MADKERMKSARAVFFLFFVAAIGTIVVQHPNG